MITDTVIACRKYRIATRTTLIHHWISWGISATAIATVNQRPRFVFQSFSMMMVGLGDVKVMVLMMVGLGDVKVMVDDGWPRGCDGDGIDDDCFAGNDDGEGGGNGE